MPDPVIGYRAGQRVLCRGADGARDFEGEITKVVVPAERPRYAIVVDEHRRLHYREFRELEAA